MRLSSTHNKFGKPHGLSRGLRPLRMGAVGLVWLCACGGDGGTSGPDTPTVGEAEIRSIDEVAASGPPQVTNITTTDAVLQFDSTIPLPAP